MARAKGGQFVSGAGKEDFVPQSDLEKFMNKRKVKMAFTSDVSDVARTRVATGLEMELVGDTNKWSGVKWVLYGAVFGPAQMTLNYPSRESAGRIECQIQDRYDSDLADAAMLDSDDPQVIAHMIVEHDRVTSGAGTLVWPIPFADITAPTPILETDIQVCIVAEGDSQYGLTRWVCSLVWALHPLDAGDVAALLQARRRND